MSIRAKYLVESNAKLIQLHMALKAVTIYTVVFDESKIHTIAINYLQ